MAKKDQKKVEEPKKLSDKEVFELAEEYLGAHRKQRKFEALKKKISTALTTELARRKTKQLQSANGVTVTFVQGSSVVYDPDGLWEDLKPKQRREVYEENIDLNRLTSEKRKEIRNLLTKEEREEVTTFTLSVDRLSTAVQNNVIDAKVVAKHSHIEKQNPYVKVTAGDKAGS